MNRQDILRFVKEKYETLPEYLWEDYPQIAVLRHINGKKWYAIIMNPTLQQLGLEGEGRIDIVNVKCDPIGVCELKEQKGFLPAYHMNKTHWITILLNGSVSEKRIKELIQFSYELTLQKKSSKRR